MKVLARLLGAAILACMAAGFAVLAVGPLTGRYQTFTVLTGSMRPVMPEGAVVVSTPVPLSKLRVGDVVTYRIPVGDRRVVTHRIVSIDRVGGRPVVVTKGDANRHPDPWRAELKGGQAWKVRTVVPKAGYLLDDLRSPLVRTVGLPLACAGLAVLWLRDIWREEDEAPATAPPAPPAPAGLVPSTLTLVALLSLGAAHARQA